MRIKPKDIFLFFITISWSISIGAQDPIYSQFYNSPLQINPAFAGNNDAPFIAAVYRNQWLGLDNAYQTFSASYDQYFQNAKSGLGMSFLTDYAGGGSLRATKVNAVYAYRLQVNRGSYIKAALDFGLGNRRLDWGRFTFYDAIDPIYGSIGPGGSAYPSAEIPPDLDNITYFDLGTGVLYVTKKYYLGVGFSHINNPNNNFYLDRRANANGLDLRWTVQAGYQYNFGDIRRGSGGSRPDFIAPNFLFVNHGGFKQINAGVSVETHGLLGGIYYRHSDTNGDAAILAFGGRTGPYKITYSFDYNLSKIALKGYGSHELSVVMNFDTGKPKIDISDCLQLFR